MTQNSTPGRHEAGAAGWPTDRPPPTVPPQAVGHEQPPLTGDPVPGQLSAPDMTGEPTTQRDTSTTVRRSRFGGIWVGLIVAALILILLLVFILQNSQPVQIDFLWMSGRAPLAVAILLGGAAGALLVAIPGTVRIMQLRKNVKHR